MPRLPTRAIASLLALLLCLAGLAAPVAAQTGPRQPPAPSAFSEAQRKEIVEILRHALRTDPSILRDAVAAIKADVDKEEAAAAAAAAAAAGPLIARHAEALTRTPGDPVAGNPNGDVTIVEFYDLTCPYCRRTLPAVAELLRTDPKVRIVYKDIPILSAGSVVGARAVLAAQRQGGYLRMREALMTGPAGIDTDGVRAAAQRLGLDWERLQRDMADPAIQARLDANLKLASAIGVQGTPAYVIGRQFHSGAMPLAAMQDMVALARKR